MHARDVYVPLPADDGPTRVRATVADDPGAIEHASWIRLLQSRPAGHPDSRMPATTSLYERLGQREGIARIARTLIRSRLLAPVDQSVIDFFCPDATAQRGMNIDEQQFVAVVDGAMAALDANGVDPGTQTEVLAILWSLKDEVVGG